MSLFTRVFFRLLRDIVKSQDFNWYATLDAKSFVAYKFQNISTEGTQFLKAIYQVDHMSWKYVMYP